MRKLNLFVIMVIVVSLVFTASCVSKEVPVTETYYETEYRTESYIEVGEEQRVYLIPNYIQVGKEQRDHLIPKRTWYSETYFKDLEWGQQLLGTYYLGYEISTGKHSPSQVKLMLSSEPFPWAIAVIDLTGVGQLPPPPPRNPLQEKTVYGERGYEITTTPAFQEWLDNYNAIITNPKRFLSFTRSDQYTGRDIVVDTTRVDEFAIMLNTSSAEPIIERVQLIWFDEITKERQLPYQVEKQRTVTKTEKVPIWEAIFGK